MPELRKNHSGRASSVFHGLPEVKGFLETSFLDWRGMISAVIFLPKCNFACPFCHNYQLVSDPDDLSTLPLDRVLDRLRPFAGWIDGIVISGGEPTVHKNLPRLTSVFRDHGFKIKLDTNGTNPGMLEAMIREGLVDMVAMDIKAPLDSLSYRRAAGCVVDMDKVRASVKLLKESGVAHEFRSTIWPAWHGVSELAVMADELRGCMAWTLQAMNPETAWNPEALPGNGPYTAEELESLQREVADPVSALV